MIPESRDARYWHEWAMRALLALGGGHLLAGIVFFFAYNWQDLSPFAKFGLIQAGMLVSFGAALALKLDKPGGKAMLIAASVFVGVLLAVIGQVYQTGADAWELFTAWSLLILPWTIASRSAAHWMLWILVALAACTFYGEQVAIAMGYIDRRNLIAIVGVLPALFLAIREFTIRAGAQWLDENWMRRSLVLISMALLLFPALAFVFDSDRHALGFLAFVAVAVAAAVAYTTVLADFAVVAIVTGFSTLVAMAIGGRLIFEVFKADAGAGSLVMALFLLGGWCAAVTAVAVRLLRSLYRQVPDDR